MVTGILGPLRYMEKNWCSLVARPLGILLLVFILYNTITGVEVDLSCPIIHPLIGGVLYMYTLL
jgi:uncharacterized integral membrane protein